MAITRHLPALVLLALSGSFAHANEAKPTTAQLARLTRPILSENCFQCHGPAEQKGDLRLDRPNPAVIPGKPAESELLKRIHESDPDEVMPPPDSHKSLSAADKKLLEDWITSGATYVSHWSFEPIRDAGPASGSMPPATPTPTDFRTITSARSGHTASGSSMLSTPTCPSTNFRSANWPATFFPRVSKIRSPPDS